MRKLRHLSINLHCIIIFYIKLESHTVKCVLVCFQFYKDTLQNEEEDANKDEKEESPEHVHANGETKEVTDKEENESTGNKPDDKDSTGMY